MHPVEIIGPQHWRSMPWKNGGGITHEIAKWPREADMDTFAWRASIAEIRSAGAFSLFERCDRSILLIEGGAMRLELGAAQSHWPAERAQSRTLRPRTVQLAPFEFFDFDGEQPVDGAPSGPVRDFNLIVRRDRAAYERSVVPLAAQQRVELLSWDQALVLVLEGTLQIELESPISDPTFSSLDLPVCHALLATAGERRLWLRSGPAGARAVWARFRSLG